MKKVLVLLALLAAVCGLLAFSAAAEGAAASGICGKNLTWTLDAAAYAPKHPHMKIER